MPNVILVNRTTGNPEEVPSEGVREALASGAYTQLSTVGTDVRETTGADLKSGASLDRVEMGVQATQDQTAASSQEAQEAREDLLGGFQGGVESLGEGILSGLTLGIYEGEQGFEGAARREINSGLYSAGELAAFAATMGVPLSPAGAAAKVSQAAGKAVTKAVGGGKLASVAGTAVEGALFGAIDDTVHQVSDVVIRDKPYVAERLVSAMEMGAIIGGATEGVLQGAKRVIEKHKGAEEAIQKAIVPPEELNKLAGHVDDATKVMDDALDLYAQRSAVLSSYQMDVAGGRAIAASMDGPWFRGSADWIIEGNKLVDDAFKLKAKVKKFELSKVLQSDRRVAQEYAEALAEYEQILAGLESRLGTPPRGLLNPQKAGAEVRMAEMAEGEAAHIRPGAKGKDTYVDRGVVKAAKEADTFVDRAAEANATNPGRRPVAAADMAGTAVGKGPGRVAAPSPVKAAETRNPLLEKYLADWEKHGHVNPVFSALTDIANPALHRNLSAIGGAVSSTVEKLAVPGGSMNLRALLKVKPTKTASALADSVLDVWATHAFAKDASRAAAGEVTRLSKAGLTKQRDLGGVTSRLAASTARYGIRREAGYGYKGMILGQVAYNALAHVGGSLAAVVGWAEEINVKAAHAVDKLLSGRTGRIAKFAAGARVSYTGHDEDATTNPAAKAAQLHAAKNNPGPALANIERALEPLVKHDPELAAHAKDAAKAKYLKLAMRAPAFIAAPGSVPKRPMGAEWDAFEEYEAVAGSAEVAVKAVASGSLTSAMGDALREQHPELARRMIEHTLRGLTPEKLEKLTPQQTEQLGYLLGQPILPDHFLPTQASYDDQRQKATETPGGATNWRGQPKATLSQQQQTPLVRPGQ